MESNKTNKPFLIGMIGHAKVGKDTCASFLSVEFNDQKSNKNFPINNQFQVALAWGLKQMAMNLGFTTDEVYSPVCKERFNETFGMTPRKAMQTIGTMFRENFGKDIWLKYLEHYVCSSFKKEDVVFVPDIRFPNEADYIKEHFDCFLIKVERPSLDLTLPMYQHESELYVDSIKNYDALIVNDTGLENLKPKAIAHIPAILKAFTDHLQQNER